MRYLKSTNKLIFTFVWLSIVVHVTHSCSSFNGWRAPKNEVHTDKNNIVKTSPQLIPSSVDQQCPEHLDRELCQNGGRCILKIEPICVCAEGWSGPRCMHKVVAGNYNVKVIRTQESSSKASTESVISTDRPNTNNDHIYVTTYSCPKPWDLDFCLHGGECRSLGHGLPMMCNCVDPYMGWRCEEKGLDGTYSGTKRSVNNFEISSSEAPIGNHSDTTILGRHARDLSPTKKINTKRRRPKRKKKDRPRDEPFKND